MIPAFDSTTGYLPPGMHPTSWSDLAPAFGSNSHRVDLLAGLRAALENLAHAGCKRVLLDGSFVTAKVLPRDYDGAWETNGVDVGLIDPVLLDFTNHRAAMKAKYRGELFPASAPAAFGVTYREFFQKDRNGVVKGVLEIDLGSLP